MKCSGHNKDGSACGRDATRNRTTCGAHHDQEKGTQVVAPAPTQPAPSINRAVRFFSKGENYDITFTMTREEQIEALGHDEYKRDRRLRCTFVRNDLTFPAGERSDEDELKIKKLREKIATKFDAFREH